MPGPPTAASAAPSEEKRNSIRSSALSRPRFGPLPDSDESRSRPPEPCRRTTRRRPEVRPEEPAGRRRPPRAGRAQARRKAGRSRRPGPGRPRPVERGEIESSERTPRAPRGPRLGDARADAGSLLVPGGRCVRPRRLPGLRLCKGVPRGPRPTGEAHRGVPLGNAPSRGRSPPTITFISPARSPLSIPASRSGITATGASISDRM